MQTPVALLDLLPTLAEVMGVPVPPEAHGRSLVPALRGERLEPWPIYSEKPHLAPADMYSVLDQGYKVIYTEPLNRVELYDLRSDPGERNNLAGQEPARARRLMGFLLAWLEQARRVAEELPRAAPPGAVDDSSIQDLLDRGGY